MKKILIFYASFGGGHLSAAKSIEKYLQKSYNNITVELIDCMKYVNKTIEKISTSAYKEMAKKAPWAWGKIYEGSQKGPLAHISSKANSFMAIKLLKLLREKNPDIVISTHPFGSQMCSYLKRKGKVNFKIATIMTDFKSHDQWLVGADYTDFFFVSNTDMQKELMQKNIEENKIIVTGIPVREEFLIQHNKEQILADLDFTTAKKTILFFGGGEFGLGKDMTLNVFECLLSKCPEAQIIAISGRNEVMKNKFESLVEQYLRNQDVRIFEFTDKVAEYMSIANLVVTKPGGLTSSESLVSHLPMVLINPIPGQEEENAEFLESKKVAKWIKKDDDINFILNILVNDETILNNMRENTYLIAKPNATENICKIIMN
ncbi:MAG: hypothetical protein ILA02_06605 [Clostridia bacterium]|nr:hypothetical protein [Clostridia bacterium]